MATVRWGTIGCGDVCERKSGPPLYMVDDSELVAVMRRTPELAEDFAKRHSVPRWYDSVDDLLADPDINAVYVATPNNTHLEPVLAAAEAGKHLLVEKPMARSAEACRQMIEACRRRDLALAVAYYRRCYPAVMRTKALIDAGEIGQVREIHINDEFPLSHRLDLVHYWCGDADRVWSRQESLSPGSHADRGDVLYVRTAGGSTASMNIGWHESGAPEAYKVTGTKGVIDVDDLKGGHMTVTAGSEVREETFDPLPYTHTGLVRNFVQHLAGGAPLACDGVEGRKSTVIMDIVDDLEPGGEPVAVDYD